MSHPSQRWIIHVDYDAFFTSVEELLNPDLRGKPVLVGGSPEGRGVVASCSYPARVFGVRSAMPMARALRLCPQAVVVRGHYRVYSQYSRKIMSMFDEITPLVEQVSIDEAFLDVTGCERLWGSAEEIAGMIQRRVQDELGLSVSLGVATAKIVAKMACQSGKPHGLVLVPPGHEAAFLAPLAIEKLWGVGQVTSSYLRSLGINTISDLAEYPAAALERALGRHAHGMQQAARHR